jgi:hypothetical protein
MPVIAHLGVGFAAKRIAPDISVIYLIIAAELVEIIFFGFVAAGIENMPLPDKVPLSPYSHSVIMGIILSVIAALITFLIIRSTKDYKPISYGLFVTPTQRRNTQCFRY